MRVRIEKWKTRARNEKPEQRVRKGKGIGTKS